MWVIVRRAGGIVLRDWPPPRQRWAWRLLPRLDEVNRQRRRNAERLMARLASLEGVSLPVVDAAAEPIYLRLPVLVRDEARHEAIFQRLWVAGIGVGRMYQRTLAAIFPQIAAGGYPGAESVARAC